MSESILDPKIFKNKALCNLRDNCIKIFEGWSNANPNLVWQRVHNYVVFTVHVALFARLQDSRSPLQLYLDDDSGFCIKIKKGKLLKPKNPQQFWKNVQDHVSQQTGDSDEARASNFCAELAASIRNFCDEDTVQCARHICFSFEKLTRFYSEETGKILDGVDEEEESDPEDKEGTESSGDGGKIGRAHV